MIPEIQRIDKNQPAVSPQRAADVLPVFDDQLRSARFHADNLQSYLQDAYQNSWETRQNVAGIVLLDLLERARKIQIELETLATEIARDRT
jgi:hypothetical protein